MTFFSGFLLFIGWFSKIKLDLILINKINMKNIFLTSLFCFFSIVLFAQGTRIITLQNDSSIKIKSNFKISQVFDDRPFQTNIGVLYAGSLGSKKEAKFKARLAPTIKQYLDLSTIQNDTAQEIQISVLAFKISENKAKTKGTVSVHFEFLAQDEEGWFVFKDFKTEMSDSLMTGDASSRHELRIREVLNASISFLNSNDSVIEQPARASEKVVEFKCTPITISSDGKLLKHQGRSYESINELGFVLLDCGNEEITKMYKKFRFHYKLGYVFASVGGVLLGYQIGGWAVSGEMNEPMLITGGVIATTSLIMEYRNKKRQKEIIKKYNASLISQD